MNLKRVEAIYDRLPELVLELDPDPVGRGPDYLQNLISKVRGYLNETSVYLQDVLRAKASLESDLEALTASFEISSNELMVTDDRVRRLPAIQDRLAMINVILSEAYRAILEKKREVNNIGYVEKAVRHRHKELDNTMSAIRLQRSLLQSDARTGAFYGDENSKSRGDTWRGKEASDPADDIESDDIDRLLAETEAEQAAEAEVGQDVEAPEPESLGDQLDGLLSGYDDDVCPEDEPLLCCNDCGEPLVETPTGMACKNGHGPKPVKEPEPIPEPKSVSKPKGTKKPKAAPKVEDDDPDVVAFLDDEDDFADIFDELDEKDTDI